MIRLGIDESGLGAWAGPYTMVGVALEEKDEAELAALGVTDSKKLSDRRRRQLVDEIDARARVIVVEIIEVSTIDAHRGSNTAWVQAARRILTRSKGSGARDIVIDGRSVNALSRIPLVRFLPSADQLVTAVGAASIVAKTIRNDIMCELHALHPEYGWDQNAGYHSKDHVEAIRRFGLTEHHRAIRPLLGLR